MITEEQHLANALTAFIGRPLDNPLTRSEMMETARIALAALTQPASPALKLPETISVRTAIAALDNASAVTTIAQSYKMAWNSCIAETKLLNAPHTAPIEPICATGGAEWVKVGERMPEPQKMVLAMYKGGGCDVLFLSRRGEYWDDGNFHSSINLSDVTHWMPLPAAPN